MGHMEFQLGLKFNNVTTKDMMIWDMFILLLMCILF